MALATLGTTKHFIVMYDADAFPHSKQRAQAILDVAEQEFDILSQWFGVQDEGAFGSANPIYAKAASAVGYGGQNAGYVPPPVKAGQDSMWINMDAQENLFSDDALANEQIRSIFIAELAEIFMSYRNYAQGHKTWIFNWSNGEALSRFCAEIRYPVGFLSYSGPACNSWLQLASRESVDYINNTEATDVDVASYGPGVLFLFYLKSQLGFSEAKIIQHDGNVLADVYRNLGQTGDAFVTFINLLRQYFPVGNTPPLDNDDPFPLNHLSFDVRVIPQGLQYDGCLGRFVIVGESVSLAAVVSNLQSIYPVTSYQYKWSAQSNGHIVGPDNQETVTVTADGAGSLIVDVGVTGSTATEAVSVSTRTNILSVTAVGARFLRFWCTYWQNTRFIPQPIPKGDSAIRIFDPAALNQLRSTLILHVEQGTRLIEALESVLRERERP